MANFNSQLTVLLMLLPAALAGMTNFWDMTPVDKEVLLCLKNEGYLEEAFVLTAFEGESQQWEVAVELEELEKLKVRTNLVVATAQIQGRLPPQLEARRLARQFHTASIDKFWISIANFVAGFQPSCNYLRTFALFLQLYTKKEVGFQSERMFWEDLFGKAEACAELGRYELYLSFNNFQRFGGWQEYEYYETYRPVPVCNYPGMEVFKN